MTRYLNDKGSELMQLLAEPDWEGNVAMASFYRLSPPARPELRSYPYEDRCLFIPPVYCDRCGVSWGGLPAGVVVRAELSNPRLVRRLLEIDVDELPVREHKALVEELRTELAAELGYAPALSPGTRIGALRVGLPSLNIPDISFFPFPFVVKQRVVDLLREEEVTGFETFSVEITRVDRKPRGRTFEVPRLWEPEITGRAGIAPEAGAYWPIDPPCSGCGRRGDLRLPKGLIVDEQAWDGSDLFTVEDRPWVLMTERVADLLTEAKFTGFTLRPAEEVVIT